MRRAALVSVVGGVVALAGWAPGASAAAPDDPVVVEAHPADDEGERDDRVTFVAGPESEDEPLRIRGPAGEDAAAEPGRVEVSTRQEVVVSEPEPRPVWWLGLQTSAALAPIPASGRVTREERWLGANRFRACLYPYQGRTCGVVKGFDFQLQLFQAAGTHGRAMPPRCSTSPCRSSSG
jgi:hypothetical protein